MRVGQAEVDASRGGFETSAAGGRRDLRPNTRHTDASRPAARTTGPASKQPLAAVRAAAGLSTSQEYKKRCGVESAVAAVRLSDALQRTARTHSPAGWPAQAGPAWTPPTSLDARGSGPRAQEFRFTQNYARCSTILKAAAERSWGKYSSSSRITRLRPACMPSFARWLRRLRGPAAPNRRSRLGRLLESVASACCTCVAPVLHPADSDDSSDPLGPAPPTGRPILSGSTEEPALLYHHSAVCAESRVAMDQPRAKTRIDRRAPGSWDVASRPLGCLTDWRAVSRGATPRHAQRVRVAQAGLELGTEAFSRWAGSAAGVPAGCPPLPLAGPQALPQLSRGSPSSSHRGAARSGRPRHAT